MATTGTLFLVPTPMGEYISSMFYDNYYKDVLNHTRYFIVEETKTTRRFLRKIIQNFPIDSCVFMEYNEHSSSISLKEFISPLLKGNDACMLSEAGCPAVADPGYPIVAEAHNHHIKVVPLIGPSSIMLALMASGLPAQQFKFNGYLPAKTPERKNKIKIIEKQSFQEHLSQIFIETPYRNKAIFNDLIEHCNPQTLLCIASNLTQPDEFIKTQTISQWQKKCWEAPKSPTVFIVYSD